MVGLLINRVWFSVFRGFVKRVYCIVGFLYLFFVVVLLRCRYSIPCGCFSHRVFLPLGFNKACGEYKERYIFLMVDVLTLCIIFLIY